MWRLNVDRGRQWWTTDADAATSPALSAALSSARAAYASSKHAHSSDAYLRALASHGHLLGNPTCGALAPVPARLRRDARAAALHKGLSFFATLQTGDGHWAGDYAGPMFLLPGLVIACYVSRTPLPPAHRAEMLRYLRNHQNPDGGFGLHIEHKSTMFSTALNYVAMRILGAGSADSDSRSARAWIRAHGGPAGCPGWGKFWLAVLGVYEWQGMDPLTPEFWLLPYALPCHPARFWCHCRVVYLPMSYLYGRRAVGEVTELVRELREELYEEPYESIEWPAWRGRCCEEDVYVRRPKLQRVLWGALALWESIWFPGKQWLRERALKETLMQITAEDENTNYICIGPVNKVINFLCRWFDDPDGVAVDKHRDRLTDYLWLAEDGMKMQGYNGSQLWDTAFASQAFMAAGRDIVEPFTKTLSLAHDYVEMTQVLVDVPNRERFYRHMSKGAWPFSTRDHGWPIADCTGEGLAAALLLQGKKGTWIPKKKMISNDRLQDAVKMILSYQNPDGGWATYELQRGPAWLEFLNPSEVFGDIMVDYSYVECTASALKGIGEFRAEFPDHPLVPKLNESLAKGIRYIESIQKQDGSWYGSWGICFLYAIWFAIDAYTSMGLTLETSPSMERACQFVLNKQREDGGWGESYLSSETMVYTQSEESLVVSTGWALVALSMARWPDREPLEKASQFLIRSQDENGDWPQQNICGVFNRNCMISYSQYRNIFPIWALAEYRKNYP
ncbi:cycloartenol synthase [Chondrus crispus]|uniref:Terpene cyclase/mutase family member n=1 Tax=Chondrus crispus TaxID=2769 RepID=R7QCF3_CHOCR|nr:cycloartenol synthase [Chondrus crispus]CDF35754.1 cycloartenol synthase [Chondrus crispus]|eukprot:XP_005715573.1 cycloartenol synthase [Chondrus crispus]